ncbi:MAG: hypothetical protein R3F14_13855 [Polyangiaceae bacterium]
MAARGEAASFAVGVMRVGCGRKGRRRGGRSGDAHWIFLRPGRSARGSGGRWRSWLTGRTMRALLAMPARVREGIVGSLLARGATFQFVAERLLGDLSAGLGPEMSARLRGVARVEPAPIEVPDVRGQAAKARASLGARG